MGKLIDLSEKTCLKIVLALNKFKQADLEVIREILSDSENKCFANYLPRHAEAILSRISGSMAFTNRGSG